MFPSYNLQRVSIPLLQGGIMLEREEVMQRQTFNSNNTLFVSSLSPLLPSLPPPPFSPHSSLSTPRFLPPLSSLSSIPAFLPSSPPPFLTCTSKTVAPSLFVVLSVPEYIICDRRLAERKSDYLPCVSIKSGISALFSLLPLEANPLHPLFTCLFHLFH